MSSAVKLALGTLLKRGATTIPEVTDISINPERADIDVTSHDSTAPSAEYIAGLLNNGTVSFSGNFLPGSANQELITTDLFSTAGTITGWSIVWVDGPKTWSFNAYVKSFNPTARVADKLSYSGTLKVTGPITIT